jgi:phytoene dehydrogenase-like protein
MAEPEVLIVGAGLSGLCCGRRLAQCEVPFLVLEASDGVGGRMRTDRVDGFLLDRGFHVFLTAYPEPRRVLDCEPLGLRPFYPGALVWKGGRFRRLANPLRRPLAGVRSLFAPVGTLRDRLRTALLSERIVTRSIDFNTQRPESLTLDYLRLQGGLSDRMIDEFFRPFFGGAFLDRSLATSSRLFRFVFRAFATGDAALPAGGIEAIPRQIAERLPAGRVRLGARVAAVEPGRVTLTTGEELRAKAVVVAAEGPEAARLVGDANVRPESNGSTTLYFAADRPPTDEPILHLDGEGRGPANSFAVVSNVAPTYAPGGAALLAASTVGVPDQDDAALEAAVREQMRGWFGAQVSSWRHLRTYRLPDSLPNQAAPALFEWQRPVRVRPGLYVCGDHRDQASQDGAMTSGFRAAQAVMSDLDTKP